MWVDYFLEVGLIRKFRWRDFAQKRWVVLQEMFVGGRLDLHSLGEGCCRSFAASLAILHCFLLGGVGSLSLSGGIVALWKLRVNVLKGFGGC